MKNRLRTLIPVSYTHLDVYKRQSVFRSADQVMPRYYVMSMIYNFHLIFKR